MGVSGNRPGVDALKKDGTGKDGSRQGLGVGSAITRTVPEGRCCGEARRRRVEAMATRATRAPVTKRRSSGYQ